MITDLRYTVTFPTNGISLSGQHSFQPGSTAISGRNGTGKSFIAEMIRYGLFGTKALRGPATDYKSLDMELSFLDCRVVRGKKVQFFNAEGEVKAVGADAVNKAIIEKLGFGLEVFDVVCAANQKESERLTRLTPTKRKELIDDVVGLTAQESVEKACRDEAAGLRREAEALTRALVLPVEPVKPAGYRPAVDIAKDLAATKALVEKRSNLQRIIDAVGDAPKKPDDAEVDVEEIEKHEQQRIAAAAHRVAVERQLASMPTATYTLEEVEQAEALVAYDADVARRGPRPDYDKAYLDEQLELIVAEELLGHDSATCPKCSHEFDLRDPTVDRAALAALPKPTLTRSEIIRQGNRLSLWENPPVEPKGVRLHASVIRAARTAHDQAPMRAALEKELAEMPVLADRSAELRAGRAVNQAWAIYRSAFDQWSHRVVDAEDASQELEKLDEPKHTVAELDAAFVAARVYESQVEAYGAAKQRFDELSAEIAEKQARAEGFAAGAKGLVEARRTLKAFLAPSLSRVASKLIGEMTVNSPERTLETIVVDEDMNITADGQDVSTFNGAHATMINLALRLALGQVLVARVFPVFIGDEIDSDADVDNAQAIADALMSCKDQLKQIVLISHKRLEGVDHEVVL